MCAGFYVDYRTRTDTDPDTPSPPKRRNWSQLITVTSDDKLENRDGGQILDGPCIDATALEALSCAAQLLRLVLDESTARFAATS